MVQWAFVIFVNFPPLRFGICAKVALPWYSSAPSGEIQYCHRSKMKIVRSWGVTDIPSNYSILLGLIWSFWITPCRTCCNDTIQLLNQSFLLPQGLGKSTFWQPWEETLHFLSFFGFSLIFKKWSETLTCISFTQ